MKVDIEIPSERTVPLSVNRGNPAVIAEPSADFSKAVRELAKSVLPKAAEATGQRRRVLSFAKA
jgi:MinD-like ATPase involved in chromosome partitioning or flagellar assembly